MVGRIGREMGANVWQFGARIEALPGTRHCADMDSIPDRT
jgi:hypothetical protein